MPESAAEMYKRHLRAIDNSLYNAVADIYGYYCVLLRADLMLAAVCETLIIDLEDARERVHQIYTAAWEADHPQFETIGEATALMAESRFEVIGRKKTCQDYSKLWDRLVRGSYRLLEKRVRALLPQLDLPPSKLAHRSLQRSLKSTRDSAE